jgi:ubiquinone/menaquinone biosynthesis C-methylase UbiE
MPDYHEIYDQQAEQYELLVSREDYQHNIARALNQVIPFAGLTVVEFGAGTGRLTCMLAPVVKFIYAFDHSPNMLGVAATKLQKSGLQNWGIATSDHRHIPVVDGVADVAIAGWSICYLVVDYPKSWREELARGLGEMRRVIRPGGKVILLETLGTGCEYPQPPVGLRPYYEYLEVSGFKRSWLRTDYLFPDRAEAESSIRFFFGETMIEKIRQDEKGVILPECTGFWWWEKEG